MVQKQKCTRLIALHSTLGQLELILFLVLLFFIGGLLAVHRNGGAAGVPPVLITLAVFLGLAGCLVTDMAVAHKLKKTLAAWLRQNRAAILLAVLTVLLRLPQLDTLPRNDSSVYYGALYKACQSFTFDPSYWVSTFRLAGHPSYGYTSLSAIPEFFFPGNYGNVWILQTSLSVFVLYCIFDLLRRQKQFGVKKAFCAAFLCSCSSMFLGLDSYYQLDFGSAVACIFTLWAMLRGKNILMVFFSFLLVLSKELGIGLFVGLFLGIAFYYFFAVAKGSPWQRILAILRQPSLRIVFIMCAVGGLAVLYYLFGTSFAWNVFSGEGSHMLGYVGFNGTYIKNKLVQLACTNFVWLQLIIQVGCLVRRKLTKKAPPSTGTQMIFSGVIGALVLYFSLSCAMVTYTVPRYNLVSELLITLATAILLLDTVDGTAVRFIPAALSLLLCLQGYFTLDPVMTTVYPKIRTGSLPLALQSNDGVGRYVGDYVTYNYQYSFQDRCIKKILSNAYDADTCLIVVPQENGLYVGGADAFYWDLQNKKWSPAPSDTASWVETLSPGGLGENYPSILASGKYKSKAVFVFALSCEDINERIKTFEEVLPDYFENLQRHESTDGLYGKMIYFTADIRL